MHASAGWPSLQTLTHALCMVIEPLLQSHFILLFTLLAYESFQCCRAAVRQNNHGGHERHCNCFSKVRSCGVPPKVLLSYFDNTFYRRVRHAVAVPPAETPLLQGACQTPKSSSTQPAAAHRALQQNQSAAAAAPSRCLFLSFVFS